MDWHSHAELQTVSPSWVYLVRADEWLNLPPHKLGHLNLSQKDLQWCDVAKNALLVIMRTGKAHHTGWSSFCLHLFWNGGKFSSASDDGSIPGITPCPGFFSHLHKPASWTESCIKSTYQWSCQHLMRYECFVNDLSSLHILAASTFAGDSVFGSASIDMTARWSITWYLYSLNLIVGYLTEGFFLCFEPDSTARCCFHTQGGRHQGGGECLYTPDIWNKTMQGFPRPGKTGTKVWAQVRDDPTTK